ncbi:MAG: U32 family peptidase, partial [Peptococcaceae bacterium]|nr:U32 family peptidase [Peptococcaceae bacterium]
DLNLIDQLAELQRLGVKSLKIEGRMKRPEYVATVTRIYRKALDNLELAISQGLTSKERYELTQIFNRGFTTGYFPGYQGADMMSFSRPNNRGTKLGRIIGIKKNRLNLRLENDLNVGDGLEIWTNHGREGMIVHKIYNSAGKNITKASEGEIVSIEFNGQARIGDRVFKTHDQELMEKARLSFQEGKETRKRPLKMRLAGRVGTKLQLEVREDEHRVIVESQTEAEEAVKRPLEYDYLYKQLGRLGNTPFYLAELDLALEGNLMLPVKEINEMRRSAVAKLLEYEAPKSLDQEGYTVRINNWYGKLANKQKQARDSHLAQYRLSVAITDLQMLNPVIKAGADRILLGGEHWRSRPVITLKDLQEAIRICQAQNVEIVWRLPRIFNEPQSRKTYSELQTISSWQERPQVMVANLAGIEMLKRIDPNWAWETDHHLYIFNQAALHWLWEQGASKVALATELSLEQLQLLAAPNSELLVFGDMEMMVSEYCIIGSTLTACSGNPRNKCDAKCQSRDFYLKDRMNYNFPLDTDRECRMHIFNAKRLNLLPELPRIANIGIRDIRLDLHRATLAQAETTVSIFKDIWLQLAAGKNISKEKMEEAITYLEKLYPEGFTKGHFYRGVLT